MQPQEAWQQAYDLVLDLYPLLDTYPEEGKGLQEEAREAAIRLLLRVAELLREERGAADAAREPLQELEIYLLLGHDLGFLDTDVHDFLHKRLLELEWALGW